MADFFNEPNFVASFDVAWKTRALGRGKVFFEIANECKNGRPNRPPAAHPGRYFALGLVRGATCDFFFEMTDAGSFVI